MSCFHANDLHKDTAIVKIAQIPKPQRKLKEQDVDPTSLNFKRDMLGLPSEERNLINDAPYMQYSRNKKRNIIRDDNCETILVKLVTYRSFRLNKYSKYYCNLETIWNKWQTPKHFQNDARNPTKV